jgi:hypothetical protein
LNKSEALFNRKYYGPIRNWLIECQFALYGRSLV